MDETALPRRDPRMEAVPAGPPAMQGVLLENEDLEPRDLAHGLRVEPESALIFPSSLRPGEPRESQAARTLEHTFANGTREE